LGKKGNLITPDSNVFHLVCDVASINMIAKTRD